MSGDSGSNCGVEISVEYPTYTGKVTPNFFGNNLPTCTVPEASSPCNVSRCRSCTRCSSPPQPGTDMFAATEKFAKSANFAFICAVAAQPPSSLNSLRRNSLTHTMAHLSSPSSSYPKMGVSLSVFRTPTMTVATFARLGLPLTAKRALPSTVAYSSNNGNPGGRSIFRF